MASARIHPATGIEIKPVEITGDFSGSPLSLAAGFFGSLDGIGGGYVATPQFALVYNGASWDRRRTPAVFKALNAVAINPEATVWTVTAGLKFRVMGYHLVSSVAGNVQLKDGGGTVIAVVPSAAGGGGVLVRLGNGILSATAGNNLTALGPAGATLSGVIFGTEE